VIQLALWAILFSLMLKYPLLLFEDINGVSAVMGNANFNATSIQEGMPFLEEYTQLTSAYDSLMAHVFQFAGYFILAQVALGGLLWVLTSVMMFDEFKNYLSLFKSILRKAKIYLYAIASLAVLWLLFMAIIYGIIYWYYLSEDFPTWLYIPVLILGVLFMYFSVAAMVILNSSSFKEFLVNWIKLAFGTAHKYLLAILLGIFAIAFAGAITILCLSFDSLFLFSLLFTLLTIVGCVFFKLFLVGCVKSISEQGAKK
jgi:hypothetical protein